MANLILWTTYHFKLAPVRTIGVYQLASWLRVHGYTVKVIDFCHTLTTTELVEITERYINKNTLAIGVSSTFWSPSEDSVLRHNNRYLEPNWVIDAREKIEIKHSVKWLLGGAKVERTEQSHRFHWIKFMGQAENSLLKWMDENSNHYVLRNSFDITKLNNKFTMGDYIQPNETLPIELARGCMFKCKFCSYPLMGKKPGTYLRDMKLVREELIRNYEEFGTKNYYILDDTVNESHQKIQKLADIIQSLPFEVSWTGYNRLDMIASKPESIQWLKDSGLRSSYFGIESFDLKASLLIGKGWNGKHGKDFLLKLKERWGNDINWTLSFIVGLRGESKNSILDVVKWCIDNNMYHWMFFPLNIDSFPDKVWKSEFDLNYEKYGYKFSKSKTDWFTDGWDLTGAAEFANQLNQKSSPYVRVASWTLLGLASLGYPINEIKNMKISDLPMADIKDKSNKFIKSYINHHQYGS